MRDHQPTVIDKFMGLWKRGDPEDTPLDHFEDGENFQFTSGNDIVTRDGIDIHQSVEIPLSNIKRIYNYPTITGNTLIVLVTNDAGAGEIYHVVNSTTVYGPLLTIAGMTDFAFIPYAGRAYISPFASFTVGELNVEKGLQNQFLYVYAGDGTAARKAAGDSLAGSLIIANGLAGYTDAGFHLFAFVAETISGYLTPPGAITGFTTVPSQSVSFGNIPVGNSNTQILSTYIPGIFNDNDDSYEDNLVFLKPENELFLFEDIDKESGLVTTYPSSRTSVVQNPYIVRRHLVATKVITNFNGDSQGYTFYFVPGGTIENNTDLFLNNISFYDADLLEEASYLFDNYPAIPAGAVLTMYRNRLIVAATYEDISVGLVSTAGEPEAIDQILGLIEVPPDGNPITNGQELRDLLYVTKRSRTVAFTDNGDDPVTWPMVLIDNALGTFVHGIATVLDSGASTVDYLIVATYQGISLFNGRYIAPELSWKIEDLWKALDRNEFRKIQIINAPIQKQLYIVLPTNDVLVGNYALGMDPMKMRWTVWSFSAVINTVAIVNIDDIILGAETN